MKPANYRLLLSFLGVFSFLAILVTIYLLVANDKLLEAALMTPLVALGKGLFDFLVRMK